MIELKDSRLEPVEIPAGMPKSNAPTYFKLENKNSKFLEWAQFFDSK